MDHINENGGSPQQTKKKVPGLAEVRAEMDPLYRESGLTDPKSADAKSYLDTEGRRISDGIEYLDLDEAGEIPLPDAADPLPEAHSVEFSALPNTKSDTELELLRHFDPETVTLVDEKGNPVKDEKGEEYRGIGRILPLFVPEEGARFAPVRQILLKDASGVVWGAETGDDHLRLSKQPITQEYPLENAEFETKELDPAEYYVLERWGRDGLSRAVDMDSGKEYRGFEDIAAAMKRDNCRLRLYERNNRGKESRMFHIYRNDVERMDDGYITKRESGISAAAVQSDQEECELIPLEQEKLGRNLADIIKAKQAAGSDFRPFALDEKGNAYRTPEEMAKQLFSQRKENRLYLFTQKGQMPHCIQQDYGRLTMSQDTVSPEYQVEQDQDKLYTPAKSLNPAEMAVSPKKLNYLMEKRSKLKEHLKLYIPRMREDTRIGLEAETAYFRLHRKPPRLGFFATIGNWFSRSFRKRPSKAYEAYAEKKKEYNEHVKKRDMLNRRREALNERENREAAEIKELDKKIEPLQQEYRAQMSGGPWDKAREIREYRKHTEVLMAGVADYEEKGRITAENIFAYTWLQEAACRGKGWDDLEAVKHLYNYIAASMAQDTILLNSMKNPGGDPRSGVMLNRLNDGSAVEALMKDDTLRAVLAEYKGPIDPETIYDRYKERVSQRNEEAVKPENRLKEARQELLARYGDKPITEDALVDVMRLNTLDNYIEASQRTHRKPGGEDRYFDDLAADKDNQILGNIIGDMVREPGKTRVIRTEPFMGPAYRKALKGVMMDTEKKLQEARQKVQEQYKDLPANVREKLMPKGNMGLEQLTNLVNEAVKNKTYENLELAPEPQKKPAAPIQGSQSV